MKFIVAILALSSFIWANQNFKQDVEYRCLNIQKVQQGQTINVPENEAKDREFVFILQNQKLITKERVSFDFRMKKGPMQSYANDDYMLLLLPEQTMGLVPKKSKGQLQLYYKCRSD